MTVLVPFVEKYVESGVQNIHTMNSPFDIETGYDFTNKEVFFNFKTEQTEKIHYMTGENRPFTVRYPMKPTKPVAEEEDYKMIIKDEHIFDESFDFLNNDMFHVDLKVQSNNPIVPAKLFKTIPEILFNPAYLPLTSDNFVSSYWRYDFIIDPTKSSCKGINTKFTYVLKGDYDVSQTTSNIDNSETSQQELNNVNYKTTDSITERKTLMQSHQNLLTKNMQRSLARSLSVSTTCVGNTNKRFDAVFTFAEEKVSSSKKFHLTLLRTPSLTKDNNVAMCFNGQILYPRISNLDTLTETTKMSLKTVVNAAVTVGKSCNVEPIFKIKGFFDVTDELRQNVIKQENVVECLDWENTKNHEKYAEQETRLEKQCQLLKSDVTYFDDIDLAFTWNNVPATIYNFTLNVENLLKTLTYQYMSLDRFQVSNNDNMMHVVGRRDHFSNLWTMHIAKPTENIIYNHLSMFRIDGAMNVKDFETTMNLCDITKQYVKTFDGVTYPFQHSKCWKVLAMDCSGQDDGAILAAEKNGHPIVKLVSRQSGNIFEIHNNQLKINGQIVETIGKGFKEVANGYYAEWSNGAISVYIPEGFMIMIKRDNIIVSVGNQYHDETCGLCGDNNKQFWADLVGPKQCVYTDSEMFNAAWTLVDQDCAHQNEQELFRQVQQFQDRCPKFNFISLFNVYREIEHETTCNNI